MRIRILVPAAWLILGLACGGDDGGSPDGGDTAADDAASETTDDAAAETADDAAAETADDGGTVGPCGEIATFADDATPSRTLHVATDGSDETGDGSAERPYGTLERAAREATPGTAIVLGAGSHAGGQWVEGLQGTATEPIFIRGDGAAAISGDDEALHLVHPRYVVLEDFTIEGQAINGVNIDDGGDYATPAEHVVVRRMTFRDVGSGGNNDCLKLSGLDRFFILDSVFERCAAGGDSGSGIDMVGCHEGTIARSSFQQMGANAVQAKGGSADVTLYANRVVDGGARAFNMGGSTGTPYFRPPGADYEARDIRAVANVIVGAEAAIAFVGCDGCLAANNTIVRPTRWVARILQESVDGFVRCRDGRFINNLVVFRQSEISTFVNVGPNTAPGTFVFATNLWFAEDDPSFAGPDLPVTETGTVVGDPLLPGAPADCRPGAGSPADGAGTALSEVAADFGGVCYDDPPAIGAHELP